jgi:hypothetical protein
MALAESSTLLHRLYAFLFGPEGGGWGYPYVGMPGLDALLVVVVLVLAALLALNLAGKRIATHEWPTIAALTALAFVAQLWLRSLGPTGLGEVVEHPGANGFLDVARAYGPIELLSRYAALADQLPMHARANLPGKTLFFHVLLAITSSPEAMGLLIVLASTCGAAMVYFLAREWFGDRRAALAAFAFYVFLPAKIYFLPLMNVLTPVFLLLPMCLVEVHFKSRRLWPIVAAGVSVYWLVIFEPLPLAAGPVVIAQILRRVQMRQIGWRDVVRVLVVPAITAIGVHAGMRILFGFDAVAAFLAALEDARQFNEANARPYWLWVGHNLKDFVIHMGLAQSLLLAAFWKPASDRAWLIVPITGVLLALAFLGINRGEIVRLWIFLGVLMQLAAAQVCAAHPRLFRAALAASILQTAVLMPTVGWITLG